MEDHHWNACLAGFRNGEAEARSELVAHLQLELESLVDSRVDRRIQGKAGVSDVLQSSLLKAVTRLDQFEGSSLEELRGWLRTIVANEIKGVRRHFSAAKRDVEREQAIAEDEEAGLRDTLATPSTQAVAREREQRFHQVLSLLSEDHQTVIRLRGLEERSFTEIAELMERSEAAVTQLWYRALLRFQECLIEDSGFESVD